MKSLHSSKDGSRQPIVS